jgi:hypothetical protein
MNPNWAILFVACSLLLPTTQTAAQEQAVLGQGNVSCDAWLSERRDNNSQASSRTAWILGYVTAFNQYGSKPAGDVSAGMGTGEIVAWIDDHCSQHPDDNLYRASAAFVDEFRQKLGR